METNKDIGAAVKHRLDGYKNSPDDLVWNHIEAQLKKKKKRRFIIVFFSGLGLSALFLLLWTNNPLQNTIQTDIPNTDEIISDFSTETSTDNTSNTTNSNRLIKSNTEEKDSALSHQKLEKEQKTTSIVSKERHSNTIKNNTANHQNDVIAQQNMVNSSSSLKNNTSVTLDNIKNDASNKTHSQIINPTSKNDTKKDSLIVNQTIEKQQDSIPKEKELTKLVSEEKEKDSITQDNLSRWSVTPQAILSYYGALSSKSNDNFSINYGLLLSYRVTERTSLRIGARQLDLKQNIDGLEINTKYLEFPLDIKYTPFNKTLNPYFTGGISYFILQEATVNNQSNPDYNTTFSLHVGLGLEYKLLNDFYFNLESNFNYQIEPISQNNEINPFILSINTGIEYRF